MPKKVALPLLVVLYLGLRVVNLQSGVNFSAEQGLFLNESREILQTKKLTLIGPATSIKSAISREFYQGPATYYLLLIPTAVGGDPMLASYFMILVNLAALIVIYLAARKKYGEKVALISGLFFASFPQLVTYTRFVWNPNFIPLFAAAASAILLFINKKIPWFWFLLLGGLLGLTLQFHYQVILLILLTFLWLIIKKVSFQKQVLTFGGLLIGFSPIIIFELRHSFYNLKTLLLILNTGTSKDLFLPPFYYFLSLTPLLVIYAALLMSRMIKMNKVIGIVILVVYLAWSVYKINSFSVEAPGMAKGWNYLGQKKALSIILSGDKKDYNIANLLTGDTRAQAMRYLLKIKGKPPMGVGDYPDSQWLFVLSRQKEEELLKNPVWEVSSFMPKKIAKKWLIQNNINLYLLEK